ncbi:reverse transcriptase [Gossypium australe]|uniref:Reverse transcriptase n=1 Tax=Gossypium australe TaxID=47621 RepID=A0A5B6UWT5_9ROSI|nr:reverse transcriptase [Gossypium australe]
MEGCLVVDASGKSGGLVMMWNEGTKVEIQSYSCNHIESLIHDENDNPIQFTGFYGNTDPNNRKRSWDMIKRVGRSVKEKRIIGGDFNAILENSEKGGGRRKSQALVDDFRAVVDELSLVDLKTDNGLFTWPREEPRDSRLNFRYDVCWAKEVEAKNIIKHAWKVDMVDIMGKMEKVGHDLEFTIKAMRIKLGKLLDKEEKYWAQRSRVNWLKEGDRNTRVIYKIIVKVLANRLKDTPPMCISQNQSAFVPRRMIHGNVLIAHELVHYLQSAKNGPNKGFVIKLDMSKVYDTVGWNFIEEVMERMGYTEAWVTKIMSCVRSVHYMVKCNSTLSETIVQ